MKAINPLDRTTPFFKVASKGDLETVLDGETGACLIEQPASVIPELRLCAKYSRNRRLNRLITSKVHHAAKAGDPWCTLLLAMEFTINGPA